MKKIGLICLMGLMMGSAFGQQIYWETSNRREVQERINEMHQRGYRVAHLSAFAPTNMRIRIILIFEKIE